MKSIFYTNKYLDIENSIYTFLTDKMKQEPQNYLSPRTAGDAFEDIIASHFPDIVRNIGFNLTDYKNDFPRRSMEDFAFKIGDYYYAVDVKTHKINTVFNMPNLVSVQRLTKFYEQDTNIFVICFVAYESTPDIQVKKVRFLPIEFMSWDCLTFGALGWGQVQISNSNKIKINSPYSRKQWMLEMCEKLMTQFYPKERNKISDRLEFFSKALKSWQDKPDI